MDAFIAKLGPDLSITEWVVHYGGNLGQNEVRAIAFDSNVLTAGLLAAGRFRQDIDFGNGKAFMNAGGVDGFLVKLDLP
jgi:hypothetical protein